MRVALIVVISVLTGVVAGWGVLLAFVFFLGGIDKLAAAVVLTVLVLVSLGIFRRLAGRHA